MAEFFAPKRPFKKRIRGQVVIYLKPDLMKRIKHAAVTYDTSMAEFCRQCIEFALDNMLEKNDGR